MTVALCAAVLAEAGVPAVLLEGGSIASASTAADTGPLQFSNDIMLHESAEQVGELHAPFLGVDVEQPGIFHASRGGGNGKVYGMMAAEKFRDDLHGRKHPLTSLLTLQREKWKNIRSSVNHL